MGAEFAPSPTGETHLVLPPCVPAACLRLLPWTAHDAETPRGSSETGPGAIGFGLGKGVHPSEARLRRREQCLDLTAEEVAVGLDVARLARAGRDLQPGIHQGVA